MVRRYGKHAETDQGLVWEWEVWGGCLFSVPRWRRRRGHHVHMIFLSVSCVLCAAWQENTVNPDLRTIRGRPTLAGFA